MTMPGIGTAPPATAASTTPRVLPPEEWDRLRDFAFATNGLPDPTTSVIIVVETATGEIVGIWAMLLQPVLDGLWVDPAHRSTLVAGQLLRTMKAFLQEFEIPAAFTVISDDSVRTLAAKAGFTKVPGDLWILEPLKKGT